jgi:CRISPR-associated protein Csb2
MITIEMRFTAGRYHATPWDAHVNEGRVDWPPSPWRLLRAILSTWYLKCRDDVPEEHLVAVLDALASELPSFRIPLSTSSHTRHFMPGYRDNDRDRVLNAFVCPEGPCYAIWSGADLGRDAAKSLDLILSRTGYMGRSESWVDMRVVSGQIGPANCLPGDASDPQIEHVELLAPQPNCDLGLWRRSLAEKEVATLNAARTSKGKGPLTQKAQEKEMEKALHSLPNDLRGALEMGTSDMKARGWKLPPGSMMVRYGRPKHAADYRPLPGNPRPGRPRSTLAVFSVSSKVLPGLGVSMSLAERIHGALVSRSGASPAFSGCDDSRNPLKGHQHASIFCLSRREQGARRGEITEVLVHCPAGFSEDDEMTLEGLERVWGYGGNDVYLRLAGSGSPSEVAPSNPVFCRSSVWRSYTPFVPTRHAKVRHSGEPKTDEHGLQIGGPEHDLRRLLVLEGLPQPSMIETLSRCSMEGRSMPWTAFDLERRTGGGRRGSSAGCGFRIVFPEEVQGPISVGYGCHFGIGLFLPEGRV